MTSCSVSVHLALKPVLGWWGGREGGGGKSVALWLAVVFLEPRIIKVVVIQKWSALSSVSGNLLSSLALTVRRDGQHLRLFTSSQNAAYLSGLPA